MRCKRCGGEQIIKNGKRSGEQCYLCKDCHHQFTSTVERHTQWEEQMSVALYASGASLRTIAALLCINASTAYRWIRGWSARNGGIPPVSAAAGVSAAEMLAFIQAKKSDGKLSRHVMDQLEDMVARCTAPD